jgi:hypothetical protein
MLDTKSEKENKEYFQRCKEYMCLYCEEKYSIHYFNYKTNQK